MLEERITFLSNGGEVAQVEMVSVVGAAGAAQTKVDMNTPTRKGLRFMDFLILALRQTID
jgi:hypothetical protein